MARTIRVLVVPKYSRSFVDLSAFNSGAKLTVSSERMRRRKGPRKGSKKSEWWKCWQTVRWWNKDEKEGVIFVPEGALDSMSGFCQSSRLLPLSLVRTRVTEISESVWMLQCGCTGEYRRVSESGERMFQCAGLPHHLASLWLTGFPEGWKRCHGMNQKVAFPGESSVTSGLRTTRIPLQVTLTPANVLPFKIVFGPEN